MKQIEILAKLKGLGKIVLIKLKKYEGYYDALDVYDLFDRYISIRDTLIDEYPSVFGDLPCRAYPKVSIFAGIKKIMYRDLDTLRSDIGYCHQVLSIIKADQINVEHQHPYVDLKRIKELESISNDKFDLKKLIEFCKELNICSSVGTVLAIPPLVRAILDHVPPIFNKQKFIEVANNYEFSRSNKNSMLKLQESSRNIADSYLHTLIRTREELPNKTQVDFKNDLDVLLQEIVRILKG